MAPLAASPILVGSTSLTNISSSRHRPPSLADLRKEGWTETWGGKDRCHNKGGDGDGGDSDGEATSSFQMPYLPPRYITVMKDGADYVGIGKKSDVVAEDATRISASGQHDASMLKLTQHRVAWLEQIVLRMNYIPHIIENSGYAAMESTGGLPCLLDLSSADEQREDEKEGDEDGNMNNDDMTEWARAWTKSLAQHDKPILVGRNQPGGLGSNFFHHPSKDGNNASPATMHPSGFLPSGSHIVDYLRLKHSHGKTKSNLLFQEHLKGSPTSGDAVAYETLIQEKLNYILLALRYGNDPAWYGVYKPQYLRATMDPHGYHAAADGGSPKRTSFFSLWAWYQTYSERTLALHNLLPATNAMSPSSHGGLAFELFRYNDYRCSATPNESSSQEDVDDDDSKKEENVHQRHPFASFFPSHGGVGGGDTGKVNVYRAMEFADMYYASLEEKLGKQKEGEVSYFLGTEKPTYIDALLFAHLAEALCDVHLILVLAKHSRLTKYFQWMYDQYFGEGYAKAWESSAGGAGASMEWIKKNYVTNALNAFNQIPEATSSKPAFKSVPSMDDDGHDMIHAIRLMQQMAVHCNELDEALRDAAALRMVQGEERALLQNYHRPIGSKLYRWIMGSDITFWGSARTTNAKKADANEEGEEDDADSRGSDAEEQNEPKKSKEEEAKQRMFREHMKQVKRDRRAQDELWLSGVVVVVAAALVISASGRRR